MAIQKVAGRYSLERQIGRGGGGDVWLGRDDALGRVVALKRIGIPPGAEEVDVARAEREARLAAGVTHPNVVAVFDLVEDGEHHWLVSEYVAGTNLARMIRDRGALPPADAARLITQAADGLAAAHALGIVHRDVKPSNILVSEDGQAKLTDFGIARGMTDVSLTQTGLVTGSPAYLSPEVATGGSATTASDVWSLGATLFHALAGRPPYPVGENGPSNALATLYRIANEPPPRLDTESHLETVLEATMTREPQQRVTAAEVASYLTAQPPGDAETRVLAAAGASDAAPKQPAPSAAGRDHLRRVLMVCGGIVAVFVLLGGLSLLFNDDESDRAADPATTSGATSPTPTETDSNPAELTAADLEQFARTYIEIATSDPDAGLQMLTDEYRAASPQYHEFWGSVSNPRILRISADPKTLEVRYTYRYRLAGRGQRTEDIVLQLVRRGDDLLIAGASAS